MILFSTRLSEPRFLIGVCGMSLCILGIIIAAGFWLAPATANAQSPTVRVDGLHHGASNPESDRAKLVGKLLQGRVTINLEKVRAREACAGGPSRTSPRH